MTINTGNTLQDVSPLVEPGEYQMVYVSHFTAYVHGTPKLAIRFRIVDQGKAFEVVVERWYNCKKLVGKPGKKGKFVPPRRGSFLMEFCSLFPDALTRSSRLDRISLKPFVNCIVTGRVKTVTTNSKQEKLPALLQYSTIEKLIGVGA